MFQLYLSLTKYCGIYYTGDGVLSYDICRFSASLLRCTHAQTAKCLYVCNPTIYAVDTDRHSSAKRYRLMVYPHHSRSGTYRVCFLSASLYFSKRGAYWDRLCRDVAGWLVVTRVHCGQTVHPRPIVTMEH